MRAKPHANGRDEKCFLKTLFSRMSSKDLMNLKKAKKLTAMLLVLVRQGTVPCLIIFFQGKTGDGFHDH